ncbi:MAG: folate family ECF transporter S component [Clostridia bacterium]|nr:folate family ECF transporter S component [Clostridia bacterium]
MQKNKKRERVIFSTKGIVFMALMIASSIVLGKLLAINITTMIRISLENLPIILTAIALGPIAGGVVALVADILGCIIVGYEINPIVTLGAITLGVICGIICKQRTLSKKWTMKLIIAVGAAHFFGSVLIKTLGLSSFYLSNYDMGFMTLLLIRLCVYIATATIEICIVSLLLRNKGIRKRLLNVKRGNDDEL